MTRRVHLVGIGGAGMSAIARVLLERGEIVTGSDKASSPYAESLARDGVQVVYGHQAENVAGADVVVASSAIPDDNPEIVAAQRASIPVLRRATFLGELTTGRRTIAVAGTHGKTTTSGLLAWILTQAGYDPSFIVGGMLSDLGTNARSGEGPFFVIEADEYDRTFLGLHPQIVVVTNVEHDHPDCFPTAEDFQAAFESFCDQVGERLVVCLDDPGAAALRSSGVPRTTYGLDDAADWRAEEIRPNGAGGLDFLALRGENLLGLFRNRLPGVHNVRNSLAALAVVDTLNVDMAVAREALTEYHGVGRRFQVIAEVSGVTVIDDYAHHPTEVAATLAAARMRFPKAALWAVFQPHTYSRNRVLLGQFNDAFGDADHVIVTEVFAAREEVDPDFGGVKVAGAIDHPNVRFIAELPGAAAEILERVRPGSVVITMSAGDGELVSKLVVEGLRARSGKLSCD